MQWVQDPRQNNIDNLNNVSPDGSRHFRQIKKKYVKANIEELETNSRIQNFRNLYRGIKNIKKGDQPTINIVKG